MKCQSSLNFSEEKQTNNNSSKMSSAAVVINLQRHMQAEAGNLSVKLTYSGRGTLICHVIMLSHSNTKQRSEEQMTLTTEVSMT